MCSRIERESSSTTDASEHANSNGPPTVHSPGPTVAAIATVRKRFNASSNRHAGDQAATPDRYDERVH